MRNLLIFLLLFSSFIKAQSSAETEKNDTGRVYHKIMIVPFEAQMYLCGIQSQIAEASGKNHQEIVKDFRYSLARELQNKFLYHYHTASLIHFNDTTNDLLKTYSSVFYKFEVYQEENLENQSEEEGKNKHKKTTKKSNKSTVEEGKIERGQIVSNKSTVPKFASLYFSKSEILGYLGNKYASDLFVFITEMDIENDISNQVALATNEYSRILKIHYAIVNIDGVFISKGVVSTTFPSNTNEVAKIKALCLPIIAEKLAAKLPGKAKEEPQDLNPLEKILPR